MPTGLATTGRPAAMYCSTRSPHFPRLQESSGSQLTPMSVWASSAASVAADQGRKSTCDARQVRLQIADHPQSQPRQRRRGGGQMFRGAAERGERAALADPGQADVRHRRGDARRRVPCRLQASGNDAHPLGLDVLDRLRPQVLVAGEHQVGRPHRRREAPSPRAALRPLGDDSCRVETRASSTS